jgi:hypothetical protein
MLAPGDKAMVPHDADRVMRWWIERLAGLTGGMGDIGLAQEVGWEKKEGEEKTLYSLAQYNKPASDYDSEDEG